MINIKVNSTADKDLEEIYFWNKLKAQDKAGLEGLFVQFAQELLVYGFSIKPDRSFVKDCIQELFIDLWRYRNNLPDVKNVKMYLFRSLSNKISKEILKEKKRYFKEQEEAYESLYSSDNLDLGSFSLSNTENPNSRLTLAINALPQRQKEVINYVFFENLSHERTSQIMGINIQSVYTLTWKAINNLKKRYIVLLLMHFLI